MRDPARIDPMLAQLAIMWKQQPDTRLGQLLSNAASLGGWSQNDIFMVEDHVVVAGLEIMDDRRD